ncbi:MAG: septum formation initiator family protein [Pseudomonadota bacterium]
MSTRQKKNSKVYRLFFPCFCILLIGYFLHHSLNGKYGSNSHEKAVEEAIVLEFKLAALQQERDLLVKRVKLLKNGSIEKDMLDEQARYHLNLLHSDEIAIMR